MHAPLIIACAIWGDSIAVGLGTAVRPQCDVVARVGASTSQIASWTPPARARTAYLSAGSNDATSPALPVRLGRLRARVRADSVVWVLPRHPRAARAVLAACGRHGDAFMDARLVRSRDGVHPSSYRALARLAPVSCR